MRILSNLIRLMVATLLCCVSPAVLALRIFACEPEWAALAQAVAPDATVFSATTAYQDPHMVQARPSLIAQLRQADLLICTGAELEVGWLPALMQKASNARVQSGQPGWLMAAEHVTLLDVQAQVSRADGDVHAAGNPHFHLDPQRMVQVSAVLLQRLQQLDPDRASQYQAQQQLLQQQLNALSTQWQAVQQQWYGRKVMAYHASFRYLFQSLGIVQIGDLEPKPGVAPSSRHLAQLLQQAQTQSMAAVIYTPYQDGRGAQWLGDKLQVPVLQLDFSPDVQQGVTLVQHYRNVLTQLQTVLGE